MPILSKIKRLLVGKPIHTKHAHHERLPKFLGLPVFASDALSSVAYASEEVLLILVLMGTVGFYQLFPIALWLGLLLIIVGFSYYQTIQAYPNGGGTYLVSTENLGSIAGRTAGSALLIDYVLTVAVSISSGVSYVVSAMPAVKPYMVPLACVAIALLAVVNLRGAKESGWLFAIPTYSFVFFILVLVAWGLTTGIGRPPIPPDPSLFPATTQALTIYLMLRAFAASCTALTGTEAIADGVQAFRPPEARNAGTTLIWMIVMLLTMFLGISWCAQHYGVVPISPESANYKTLVAELALRLSGQGFLFYGIIVVSAVILFLAANTAFADFPRLSQFIARDGFLPRQLMSVGDRLVYQNGIILLAIAAMILVIVFHASTHALIPLYALGVFISFTLSQAGMVARWLKVSQNPWRNWKMWVSLIGTTTTFCVAVILAITKFKEGAWLIFVAMSIMLFIFSRIKRHYTYLASELSVLPGERTPEIESVALLMVPRMHRGILQAIAYAKSLTKDVRAIHVTLDPKTVGKIKEDWMKFGEDIPLVILESPYRSLTQPIMDYVDQTLEEDPNCMVTVIVPQAIPKHWWQGILHNNAAVSLKLALASRKNVVITNVRYFLK